MEYELPINEQTIQIQWNIQNRLNQLIQRNFKQVKDTIASLNYKGRKAICEIIQSMPKDEERVYTKRKLLKLVGISKTNYYAIINNHEYGAYQKLKEEQDMKDIEMIQKVVNYKGYPKGNRMIHIMLPMLCKTSMSRNKIRRLCRIANIQCKVRKANHSRRGARELLARNVKPNLLKRQFRLAKPNQIYLTDVTYLKYGTNQTAYLSDIKDAVTGRICAYVVSDSNDLTLALNTLEKLGKVDNDAIFHSDQGTLYLNDSFQAKLKEMGLIESMSRRGNCWDNASKESYYGHFKDEVTYRTCNTLEEVVQRVDEYVHYYNHERPQWTRNKMTPIAYEAYMNSLSDKEFEEYLAIEQGKYQKMMEKAREKAKKRAIELGA